jgi:hypothetical protein
MQISHIEVRRHPNWKDEAGTERLVDHPTPTQGSRAGWALVIALGMLAVCAGLVAV